MTKLEEDKIMAFYGGGYPTQKPPGLSPALPQLSEHDEGAHPGALPAAPPEGEQPWQGRPSARGLARQNFHVFGVALFSGAADLAHRVRSRGAGKRLGEGLSAASVRGMPFLAAEAVLLLLAWGYARSTIYTLTSARLAIRSGLAVPVTTTIAFELVEGAALKRHGKDLGDLCFTVRESERPSWAMLWPSVRPWRWRHPEPSFRCVPHGEAVALKVKAALEKSAPATTPSAVTTVASSGSAVPTVTVSP